MHGTRFAECNCKESVSASIQLLAELIFMSCADCGLLVRTACFTDKLQPLHYIALQCMCLLIAQHVLLHPARVMQWMCCWPCF